MVIEIYNLRWPVLINGIDMRIGCQIHSHQEWEDFTGDEIAAMAPRRF